MRKLKKLEKPSVLTESADKWKEDFLGDKGNKTKRYRYRHPEIKSVLNEETGWKCIYCESKLGHNTPGDIEHKVPMAYAPERAFEWENLTVACTECNRRKNDYYSPDLAILDPYEDDVEAVLVHHGPVVSWVPGESRAEVTVKTLELSGTNRVNLVVRKIEKIEAIEGLLERWSECTDPSLKKVLEWEISNKVEVKAEYSAMAWAVLEKSGFVISS